MNVLSEVRDRNQMAIVVVVVVVVVTAVSARLNSKLENFPLSAVLSSLLISTGNFIFHLLKMNIYGIFSHKGHYFYLAN